MLFQDFPGGPMVKNMPCNAGDLDLIPGWEPSGCVCVFSHSVLSDSSRPRGLKPSRLLCPWDSPGRNTGVDCHFLLQGNLPDPGITLASLTSLASAGRFFTTRSTWASLLAQQVKNPPAMRKTRVQSLGWEDPLERGKATHSSVLA